MNITPIEDKVLVAPDAPSTTAAEGLIIPDNARQIIVTGTVLGVGPGRARKEGGPIIPIELQPGDRVLYERHMGTELKSGGQRVLLLAEKHVQGVLGPDTRVEFPPPPPPPPQENPMGTMTGPGDFDV